ncbi:MAG: RNA polymerase sigma factor [Planctomycetota bacterium]
MSPEYRYLRSDALPDRVSLEACVETCAERAWRLAYALLRSHDDAFDVVQQACLVAALKPGQIPRPPADPWPWFSVVIANEARNSRRKARRSPLSLASGEKGESMDVVDHRGVDPTDALAVEDSHRALWREIDALPEPERTALVLTRIGGLSHEAVARSVGVPRQTLTSQIARAMERLRARLRREDPAILAQMALLPVALPDRGWSAAIAAWKTTASAGLAAKAAAGTMTLGGIMTLSKPTLAAAISVALGVGLTTGYFAGDHRPTALRGVEERAQSEHAAIATLADAPAALRPVIDAAIAEACATTSARVRESFDSELAALRAQHESVVAERDALRGQLAELETPSDPAGPTFTFGEGGQLPEVAQANWAEMAEASHIVAGAIKDMVAYQDRGEPVPTSVGIAMQENVEKMRKYEYRVFQKLPSEARFNGEFTHPISVTNLLAAELTRSGLPLTAPQVEAISRVGEQYEQDAARYRDNYPPDTLRVRRILDEYLLKSDFTEAVYEVLTREQRQIIIDPATNRIAFLDLYCPSLMIIHTSPILQGATPEELKTKLGQLVSARYSLADAEGVWLEGLLQNWRARVAPILHEVPPHRVRYYTFEESVIAGHATVELLTELLGHATDDAARATILDEAGFLIPRLVAAPTVSQG